MVPIYQELKLQKKKKTFLRFLPKNLPPKRNSSFQQRTVDGNKTGAGVFSRCPKNQFEWS